MQEEKTNEFVKLDKKDDAKTILKKLPIILYDVIASALAVFVATIITNGEKPLTNYMLYLPYYLLVLMFLQVACYVAFNVYNMDLYSFDAKALIPLGMANAVVLICNIAFVLITQWFSVLWVIYYIVIVIALTCGLRFIFRMLTFRKEEKQLKKELEELNNTEK